MSKLFKPWTLDLSWMYEPNSEHLVLDSADTWGNAKLQAYEQLYGSHMLIIQYNVKCL